MRPYIICLTALMIAGCSAGSSNALAPNPALPQDASRISQHHVLRTLNHYSCPATGAIVYVSDLNNDVINVYKGDLAGQPPCGQIGSRSSLSGPGELFVQPSSHDLYVANSGFPKVEVFHRGRINPYNSYVDQSHQPVQFQGAAVTSDGTLIANNDCSLSTWTLGSNGGTFVGFFEKKNCQESYSTAIAVDKNDTVYYDGMIGGFFNPYPAVFTVSCPRGNCGTQHKVEGLRPVLLYGPQGMAFDGAGDLLVTVNGNYPIGSTLPDGSTGETFALPNPIPKVFHISGYPEGMAINQGSDRWFVALTYGGAAEYSYPSGQFIGSVPANANGYMDGVAVDQ